MSKGIDRAIIIFVMVVIFILSFSLFVASISSASSATYVKPEPTTTLCPDDCDGNTQGTRCLEIYDSGSYSKPFCGCITKDDCININGEIGDCIERKCQ